MLYCDLCNYFMDENAETKISRCSFTGQIFLNEAFRDMDEYPCYELSFADYLKRTSIDDVPITAYWFLPEKAAI